MFAEATKRVLSEVLPDGLLSFIKRRHYVRSVARFWEPDMDPLPFLVHPGDCVVDIGANVGFYTNLLSGLVGESGKVFAIEPIPETFHFLTSVVDGLKLKNVDVMNSAISSKDGLVNMEVPRWSNGMPNFYQARIVQESSGRRVMALSLDSLSSEMHHREITFIKCDVEGHEVAVIKGAAKLLEDCKPAWLMEVPRESAEVFGLMEQHGYAAYWFDGLRLNKRIDEGGKNYLFLQPCHEELCATLL